MRRSWIGVLTGGLIAALACAAAPAAATSTWLRPVAGRVVREFRAPLTTYGAGHLGVDFAAAPGAVVRAAGAGTVVFAGTVAGARHVVVRHAGGLRTSYSFLASILVRAGRSVRRGAVLGTAGGAGERHDGSVLHFGLRVGDTFVDPMRLFAAAGVPVRVHLAPLARTRDDPGAEARFLAPPALGAPRPPVPAPSGSRRQPLPAALPMCDGQVALRC